MGGKNGKIKLFQSQISHLIWALTAEFGVLHSNQTVGTIAVASFAIALCRRGRVCDAVVAHGITNAMLAIYVLGTHRWSFWN